MKTDDGIMPGEEQIEQIAWMGRRGLIKDSGSVKQWIVNDVQTTRCASSRELTVLVQLKDEAGAVSRGYISTDRLELVPEKPVLSALAGYMRTGEFYCTGDEALEWLAFVMLQAGSLFQNVPAPPEPAKGDFGEQVKVDFSRDELIRLLTVRGESASGPVVTAALAYYDAALAWYDKDREQD